jgi:spore maturation protein CgeB
LQGLCGRGHRVLFLECDKPWYAAQRDLPRPPWGETELYENLDDLKDRFAERVRRADLVIVGSFVPEGRAVIDWVRAEAEGAVAFYDIDTPVTLGRLQRGECEYLAGVQIPRFDLYLSFTGGPTLERLQKVFGAQRARALYCSIDPEAYFPEPAAKPTWDLGYMGTWSADRQATLERLMLEPARRWEKGRFIVAGPLYPPELEWPSNVERIEHVAAADHPAFYARQRCTLNVTRARMVRAGWSPSVRLFEAAACGTPIVSDRWEGLEHFFAPGEEIAIAERGSEVLEVLRRPPDALRGMAERARARVLREHTPRHRAEQLEGYVEEANAAWRASAAR